MNSLRLRTDARDAILAHAREGALTTPPSEVCGVLGGRRASGDDGADTDAVAVAEPVANVAEDTRTQYVLDPAATVETIDAMEADGHDVVGFYHSHPESDPVPSRTDEQEARWTGYVYLVCHPDGRLNAYRFTGDAFEPLEIVDAE
ncbi:desampylase [Halogeometricum limi]|uniref:Proteasome lid subunit RPN8/RPN11, contains Jab1/MPN metalloenzyme (JAMM) motif n=1 Tax=Halogeometricum limi TaxID=555875 RepID=A0A1I6HM62_9EURY|nr:desampylase [Halogeometricum limi]SFR55488.1 Proteasome lid subunit RPN8/RPN11, contains Jab1/MPN metalloenzyme (JAMM) motif [Halogeometricum limi]